MTRITDIPKVAVSLQMAQGDPVSPNPVAQAPAPAPVPPPAPAPFRAGANTTPPKSTPARVAEPSNAFKHAHILRTCMAPVVKTSQLAKFASYGFPSDLAPAGAMPANPAAQFGSFMDIARPLRHPITSTQNFVSGLGSEADRMLTQSMVEQPITIHQQQQHPLATN